MTTDLIGSRLRRSTAAEYAHAELRRAIFTGTLKGGAKLVQGDIAAQFGMSTTPVREALRSLASEGLVTVDPHHVLTVRPLTLSDAEEVYELRITLEPIMIRRRKFGTPANTISQARQLLDQMKKETDIALWVELNRAFHTMLDTNTSESRLATIVQNLRDSASTYVALSLRAFDSRRSKSDTEHRELLSLYEKDDNEAIVKATIAHLGSTLSLIRQVYPES